MEKPRTPKMNNSLHLLFDQVANDLLGKGIERRTVMLDLEGYSCPVDAAFLKEVWRTIQYTQTAKLSTTQLTTQEMKRVYETFQRFMAENYGVHCPWPSYDALAFETLSENNQ